MIALSQCNEQKPLYRVFTANRVEEALFFDKFWMIDGKVSSVF